MQPLQSGGAGASDRQSGHGMIDRKRRNERTDVRQLPAGIRPALQQGRRQCYGGAVAQAGQRVSLRRVAPALLKSLLKGLAENIGRVRGFLTERHRDDAVGVDGGKRNAQRTGHGAVVDRHDEGRKLIGDQQGGVFSKRFEQAGAGARSILCITIVIQSGGIEVGGVFGHPLKDKGLKTIAGPGIVAAQSFVDQERKAQSVRPGNGILQGEVGMQSSMDLHPVEHISGARARRALTAHVEARAIDVAVHAGAQAQCGTGGGIGGHSQGYCTQLSSPTRIDGTNKEAGGRGRVQGEASVG